MMKRLWDWFEGVVKQLLGWFEHGDLVPLAVIISVAHYGPVLVAHGEFWLVAWAVGMMVDLLHFRSVRYAFTDRRWVAAVVAMLTTVIATGYHLRFYANDWLLALPIPVGIAILAWHASEKERGIGRSQLAIVQTELAGARHLLADLEIKLQESASQMQEVARRAQESVRQAQEADGARQEAVRRLQDYEIQWSRLNPLAQDIVSLVMTKRGSQTEIARKHDVSESKVSRIKAELNGGG